LKKKVKAKALSLNRMLGKKSKTSKISPKIRKN